MKGARLALLLALAGCRKERAAPVDAAPPEPSFEPAPPWLPVEGPPAGDAPCRGSTDATSATRTCYAGRIRPALLAVAKTKRLRQLPLGDRAHVERQLATEPRIRCGETAKAGRSAEWIDQPRRWMLGHPQAVVSERRYYVCSVEHSAPGTPPDGGLYLGLYVDAETLDVVYAYVPDCC